jgi:hypothetical protein
MHPINLAALTPLQRALATYYMDTIGDQAIKSVACHRAGLQLHLPDRTLPRRDFHVLELELRMSDSSSLYFYGSLGDSLLETGVESDHEHEFGVLTDLHSEDVAHLVAEARAHHTLVARLDVHHSFLLPENSPSRQRGYSNVLVAGADLWMPFDGKSEARLAEKPVRLLSLILMTPRETQIKLQQGTQAVWDDFRSRGRDLLII